MSADIGPGDWVEALKDCAAGDGCAALVAGTIRRVIWVGKALTCMDCGDNSPVAVNLDGDDLDGETSWCTACCVRPIYRPNATLIEQLSAPAPRESVPA
jgi:hypothetical protein